MIPFLLLPLLLCSASPVLSSGPPCAQVTCHPSSVGDQMCQVTSSECSRDEPSIVYENHLESEEECRLTCNTFETISIGCTFAAWSTSHTQRANCRLYVEPFWKYLNHCDLLAGPSDLSDCDVDRPEDHSCDVLRYPGPGCRIGYT